MALSAPKLFSISIIEIVMRKGRKEAGIGPFKKTFPVSHDIVFVVNPMLQLRAHYPSIKG